MLLLDDIFVEILLYHMRLVFLQGVIECLCESLFALLRDIGIMSLNHLCYVFYAVLAECESGRRVEYRHVVLIMYGDDALAEAALIFMFVCHDISFLSFISRVLFYYLIWKKIFQADFFQHLRPLLSCDIILECERKTYP